jgi:hypothetical protein
MLATSMLPVHLTFKCPVAQYVNSDLEDEIQTEGLLGRGRYQNGTSKRACKWRNETFSEFMRRAAMTACDIH